MSDWTPQERKIKTPYGIIHYGGSCNDHYANFRTIDQFPGNDGNVVLTLQGPAMRAFIAAQVRYARRTMDKKKFDTFIKKNPNGRPIIILAGTNRSCSTQRSLWLSDKNRYASPDITGHTRGLAIDRSNAQPNLNIVDQCLAAEGWNRTRPDDEPWHWSYGVTI
jgi:hypothetical protein